MNRLPIVMSAAMVLVACGGPLESTESTEEDLIGQVEDECRRAGPTGKGVGTRNSIYRRTRYGLKYHGGQVMLGSVQVYYIFYGSWSGSAAPQILIDLVLGLSGSQYYAINTQYKDATGAAVSNALAFGRSTNDAYSMGASLSDADIQTVVQRSITGGQLPLDPNGIYFVVGSEDVDATSGMCRSYCGFHQSTTVSGINVKYGFVGDAQRCPNRCAPQLSSPNGDVGADAMASTLATLISGTVSNPQLNGWYDRLGLDGADKCAWSYGPTYQAPNGALANISLRGRDFLLPRNWVMSKRGGTCALSLPQAALQPETVTVD